MDIYNVQKTPRSVYQTDKVLIRKSFKNQDSPIYKDSRIFYSDFRQQIQEFEFAASLGSSKVKVRVLPPSYQSFKVLLVTAVKLALKHLHQI